MTSSAAPTATSGSPAVLTRPGFGQLLDIVPNHMALHGRANAWWWDVLENGPASRYAGYFDIDWDPPERKLTATVLMPILADRYGRVLEAGELQIRRDKAIVRRQLLRHEAPLSPRTLDDPGQRWPTCWQAAGRRPPGQRSSRPSPTELGNLPHAILTDAAAVAERHEGIEELQAQARRAHRPGQGTRRRDRRRGRQDQRRSRPPR